MSSSCFNYCVPSTPNREALGALPSDCDNREGQPVASQRMGVEIPLTTQTKHRACPAQRKKESFPTSVKVSTVQASEESRGA